MSGAAAASPPDMFPAARAIVLEEEGVFSDNAQDPGGSTYYGIARAAHPDIPWPPSKDQAVSIYRAQYWDAHRCGEMPWSWALAIFDGEVNQGSVIGLAQKALGLAGAAPVVGSITLGAMRAAAPELFDLFLAYRALSYVSDKGFVPFGKGWLKRLARIARGAAQQTSSA